MHLKSTATASRLRAGYGCEDVAPGGFVSLMDLYEHNYMRLRRLIPDVAVLPENAVSDVPGCLSLFADVIDHTDFTTTLRLTYHFHEDDSVVLEPDITLRIYHDAHQAEVLTGHLKHGRLHYDHIPEETMAIKWKLNRFLYKWLGFCLHLGHTFTATADRPMPEHSVDELLREEK
jgi:uncharacterized protein YqiB (DUF1249 family)